MATRKHKPGRNERCPCGSGRKYKSCCSRQDKEPQPKNGPTALPVDNLTAQKLRREDIRRRRREARYGKVKETLSVEYRGERIVAVGNQIYWPKRGRKWRTFIDFLPAYLGGVFGAEWGQAELAKPSGERHPVVDWYVRMCRFQQRQEPNAQGVFAVTPNGAMKALICLAYDLYVLKSNAGVQERLVARLKNREQFQGARHEVFAAATCVRAGYALAYEDEGDKTRTHPEFVGVHKATGQEIDVEAKSRHVRGVLGFDGGKLSKRAGKIIIRRLLKAALGKNISRPYVVFVDLNTTPLPPDYVKSSDIKGVLDQVCKFGGKGKEHFDPYCLVCLTNHPYHYGGDDERCPSQTTVSLFGRNPTPAPEHLDAIMAIHTAAEQFGNVPNCFDE